MNHFYRIYQDYEHMTDQDFKKNPVHDPDTKPLDKHLPLCDPERPNALKDYVNELYRLGYIEKTTPTTITAIGVWDTVGQNSIALN
jgi:hypothetical protein